MGGGGILPIAIHNNEIYKLTVLIFHVSKVFFMTEVGSWKQICNFQC